MGTVKPVGSERGGDSAQRAETEADRDGGIIRETASQAWWGF